MAKSKSRSAQGSGTIRKKTVMRNGTPYEYWEARITTGRDPGTGKQVQRSIYGKTQKEVRQKLSSFSVDIDNGTYISPQTITVGEWIDTWLSEYLEDIKHSTKSSYTAFAENHIKPNIGAIKLQKLTAPDIQKLYNTMNKQGLSPKTIKNCHGVVHRALEQAVGIGYLKFNPSSACKLPRIERPKIRPLDDDGITKFLSAIKGSQYETLFTVILFTGMREGEALGLMWKCVDFKNGTILIDKQLQAVKGGKGQYAIVSTKNDKPRTITPAPFVMSMLKKHKANQLEDQKNSLELWTDTGLVFTNAVGDHLAFRTVYKHFKKAVASIGFPDVRLHDLRHSYAVASIRSGDDIKTVQGNLGHASAAFTLDVYGHLTSQMQKDSAQRMESFIEGVVPKDDSAH